MKIPIIRLNVEKDREIEYGSRKMSAPDAAVACIWPLLEGADREYVIACGVDTKNKPVYIERVAIGSADTCVLSAHELFRQRSFVTLRESSCFIITPRASLRRARRIRI